MSPDRSFIRAPFALHFVAACLWSAVALAAPATPAAIDELLHKSGLWEQLAAIGPQLQQGINDSAVQEKMPDDQSLAAMRRAFGVAYGPERLRAAMARALAKEITAEDTAAALAWLATDLGKRVTRLEEDASKAAVPDRAAEIAAALPAERRELYLRMARATHTGEVGATIMINVTYGLVRGARLASPGTPMQDPEQLLGAMQATRAKLVAMVEEQSLGTSAVAYGTLSDADLLRYIEFAESPVGRRYHAATSLALDRALTDAAVEAGRLLVTGQST
jgi:Uncharacterized protein conserved in bacteria (DUF2059)